MIEKLVLDEQMEFALKFKYESKNDVMIYFEGVTVVGSIENYNTPEEQIVFCNYDLGRGLEVDDINKSFEEAFKENKLLSGFIKWDGCMEIHDFNHHWCYHTTFAQRIVDMIYKEAKLIMKMTDFK